MGITTLVGEFNGTTPAAVMVDESTRRPFGPLFEGDDALAQIEGFLDWMVTHKYMRHAEAIGLLSSEIPDPLRYGQSDPREWGYRGLRKLVSYWKREHWDLRAVGGGGGGTGRL